MLSARNQLPGTIKSIKLGTVMAEVVVDVAGVEVVAAISGSVESLGLKVGDEVHRGGQGHRGHDREGLTGRTSMLPVIRQRPRLRVK